jgi:hypothetical protein
MGVSFVIDSMMDKGKPLEGKGVTMCVSCRQGAKDNDQVFIHKLALRDRSWIPRRESQASR